MAAAPATAVEGLFRADAHGRGQIVVLPASRRGRGGVTVVMFSSFVADSGPGASSGARFRPAGGVPQLRADGAGGARGARGDAQGTSDVSPGVRHAGGRGAKSDALWSCLEDLHANGQLTRFVVDEAHCVSSSGHDFRPDYKKLGDLKKHFPDVPMTALTATATPEVRADVLKTLGIKNARGFVVTFNRPNIEMTVKSKKSYRDASTIEITPARVGDRARFATSSSRRRDRTARSRHQRRTEKTRARTTLSGAGGGGVQRGHVDVGSCRVSKRVDARRRGGVLRHHRLRDGHR